MAEIESELDAARSEKQHWHAETISLRATLEGVMGSVGLNADGSPRASASHAGFDDGSDLSPSAAPAAVSVVDDEEEEDERDVAVAPASQSTPTAPSATGEAPSAMSTASTEFSAHQSSRDGSSSVGAKRSLSAKLELSSSLPSPIALASDIGGDTFDHSPRVAFEQSGLGEECGHAEQSDAASSWRSSLLSTGSRVDCRDKDGQWYEAEVIEVDMELLRVKIHFVGWSRRWDLWLDQDAEDLAPVNSHATVKPSQAAYWATRLSDPDDDGAAESADDEPRTVGGSLRRSTRRPKHKCAGCSHMRFPRSLNTTMWRKVALNGGTSHLCDECHAEYMDDVTAFEVRVAASNSLTSRRRR